MGGHWAGRTTVGRLLIALAYATPLLAMPASHAAIPPSTPAVEVRSVVPAAADSGERPLVIVLDTSDSMSEEDGTGTIKLAGAQVALTRMLREQRPGALVGLWGYPTGDCGAGRSVIDTQPLDQSSMIKAVRGLRASGDTPTGRALRAVVRELQALGYNGATILLISDGLSNCDPDPCAVAEDIVDQGFDVTVEAAGFRISREGMQELRCIAAATGGGVHRADDAEELGRVVDKTTNNKLVVEVRGMPTTVPAGTARAVEVTVKNPTSIDVQDAQVAFSFANASGVGPTIVPSVLPPRKPIGNLKAGQQYRHTWLVSFGSPGKTGEAGYRITAWGANSQPVSATGTVDVSETGDQLADAGPLIKELAGQRIAILGDSFSSGEGAGNYQPGTDDLGEGAGACHKSYDTYLLPLFEPSSDVELLACSGAVTRYKSIDGKDRTTNAVQEEQVWRLRERQEDEPVAAAFMTIGGNDIGFGEIISRCVFNFSGRQEYLPWIGHPWALVADELVKYGFAFLTLDAGSRCADDHQWVDEVMKKPAQIHGDVLTTYRQVYDALNDPAAVEDRGDVAPLYILAYPQMFAESQWTSVCPFFDPREIDFANDLVEVLNDRLALAVQQRQREGDRIHLIRTTQEAFLPDHTACPRPQHEQWVNSLNFWVGGKTIGDKVVNKTIGKVAGDIAGGHSSAEYMHPNAAGYKAETNAIIAWSLTADEEQLAGHGDWRAPEDEGLGVVSWLVDTLQPGLPPAGPAVFDAATQTWTTEATDVRAGQTIEIRVENAAPGSTITISIESRPRVLGTVTVGDDGSGSAELLTPALIPPGPHTLTAVGFAEDGSPAMASQPVDVSRYIPAWLLPLAAATLVSLGLAVWFFGRHRRLTRS